MPTIALYTAEGTRISDVEVSPKVFSIPPVLDLIHQAVVAERANLRNVVAHTKTRGEVRGGGRKPWKQKGTGRARAGSIRSPLWRGGGITFGPRSNRNFRKKLNRQMFRRAVAMVLADKLKAGQLIAVEKIVIERINTKAAITLFAKFLESVKLPAKRIAVVTSAPDAQLSKSLRNAPHIELMSVQTVSPYRLLRAQGIILEKPAIAQIEKWLSTK